jgi:AcrR family transcriptional regulator
VNKLAPAAQDARDRILEAACELIAGEGIDEVRIARVAMRAGASTALVHHYFSTREELLEQALLHSFELAGEERFSDEPAGERTASRGLARMIEECLPAPGSRERDWVLWVELWLRAVRDPSLRSVAAQLYERYRSWLASGIHAGVDSGEYRPCDPDAVADHAMALLDGFGIRAMLGDPSMDVARARTTIARLLAAELGVDAKELEW